MKSEIMEVIAVKYRIVYVLYLVPTVEQLLSERHEMAEMYCVSISLYDLI